MALPAKVISRDERVNSHALEPPDKKGITSSWMLKNRTLVSFENANQDRNALVTDRLENAFERLSEPWRDM